MKRALGVMAAILLAMATAASAVPVTWNYDGAVAASNSWDCATSWSPASAPVAGDNVVLGNIITASRILTLGAPYSIHDLTVNNTNAGSLYNLTSNSTTVRNLTFTGTGTILSVGALGANLAPSATPTYVTIVLPNTAGLIWDIGGPTYVGTVNTGGAAATLTKTGSGLLTWGGSGNYAGTLTVNAGDLSITGACTGLGAVTLNGGSLLISGNPTGAASLTVNGGNLRLTGSPTGFGNFSMSPTGAGSLTFDGTGTLGLALNKTARFLGTGSGNVIVSPGTTAGDLRLLRIGTFGNSNTVTLDNLSRYNAEVNGAVPGFSDALGVIGTLSLGAAGTTNSLYISLASGSLQSAYILAGTSTALSGKFNQVYYNNVLVANPETAGAIGTTHQLVYGAKSLILVNPSTNRRNYWVNPDTSTVATTSSCNTAGNWSSGTVPTAADNVYVQNGGSWHVPTGNQNITYGEFVIGNGSNTQIEDMANLTLNVVDDCGTTGDFVYRSTTSGGANWRYQFTLNIDGNYLVNTGFYNIGYEYTAGHRSVINLYGTNKGFRDLNASYVGERIDRNIYGSYFDNGSSAQNNPSNTITVKNGGRIIKRLDNTASTWEARRFIFEGGPSNLPNLGDCVTFSYMPNNGDNGPAGSNRLVIAGGIQYPQDVRIGAGYRAGAVLQNDKTFTWRLKTTDCNPAPQTVIGRDFLLLDQSGSFLNDGLFVNFEENGTLAKVKVVVKRNMSLIGVSADAAAATRGSTPPTFTERLGFRAKNAELRVGQDLLIGTASSAGSAWWPKSGEKVDLGNATIYVGRNLTVYRLDPVAKAFWSGGTSTIICDGNGTGKTQQIRTYGIFDNIKLNNFIVRNPGGIVVLENALMPQPAGLDPYGSYPNGKRPYIQGGDLLLSGNLSIECGTFKTSDAASQPGRQIAFNGDCHTIYVGPGTTIQGTVGTVLTAGVFDNIILRTDAQLTLLSNLTIAYSASVTNPLFYDNLVMMSGSKLYLNTFTLMAEGHTWISDQVSSDGVPWDGQGGKIYGTLAIPEPATLLLVGTGALGALGWLRRRRMR